MTTDQTPALPPLLAAARVLELDRDAASFGENHNFQRGMTRAIQLLRLLNEDEPTTAVGPAPATDQTDLRELVAEALHGDQTPGPVVSWAEELPLDREYFLRRADAVLAVLPEHADRAAVLREAANIVRSMDSDYALQEAAEHLDGLAVEADEEREAQAHLDALAPLAEGAPLPDADGPALYEKLTAMFSGPLPWPPDSRPDLVTLRERIAEDLYAHDHLNWRVPLRDSDVEPVYRERALAVLTGLRRVADETPPDGTQTNEHPTETGYGPSAEELAGHIAAQRISVLQGAFRILGWRLGFALGDAAPAVAQPDEEA